MRYRASSFAAACVSLLLLACRAPLTTAFPGGAPAAACNTLSPDPARHGANPTPCGESCPFTIILSGGGSNSYRCGEPSIGLRIISTDQTPFRGFFTQSRASTDEFTSAAPFVGSFVNLRQSEVWQIRSCDNLNAGATHTDRSQKFDVLLEWQPPMPGEFAPPVTFWLTIVQQLVLYHVQLPGLVLQPDPETCEVEEPVQLQFVDDAISVEETAQLVSVCVETLTRILSSVTADLFTEEDSGTADEGSDYLISDGIVVFESGTLPGTTQCFSLFIVPDDALEGDETFVLGLRIGEEETIDRVTVTITEEEEITPPVVGFQFGSYVVTEGQSIQACAEILSGSSRDAFSLQMLSILAGTASDNDIMQIQTIVTFPQGSTTGDLACVDIIALSDNVREPPEFLFLVLFQLLTETTPFTIDRARMVVSLTVINSDIQAPMAFVRFTENEKSVSEGDDVEVSCLLFTTPSPLQQDVVVFVVNDDDTAVSFSIEDDPPDYLPVNNNVTIPSGTLSNAIFCVSVSLIDDDLLEIVERFTLNLQSLSPDLLSVAEGGGVQNVSIVDNEPRVSQFRPVVSEIEIREGSIPPSVLVCIELVSNGPLLETIFIAISVENGTAGELEDFVLLPAPPNVFPVGSRAGASSCRPVIIVNDDIAELDERFYVNFISLSAAGEVVDPTVAVNIEDDDVLYVRMLQPSISQSEDGVEVFVCVLVAQTRPVLEELRLRIGTADGTAIATQDYVMQQTELIFPPGTQTGDVQCLGVPLIDNNTPEDTRYFRVSIVSFTPFIRIFQALDTTFVSITDDDESQVAFEQTEYPVVEGAGTVRVCVVLLGDPLTSAGLVRVMTESGTASAGSDYLPINTTQLIPPFSEGRYVVCVFIVILNDGIAEAEQSFSVLLSSETPDTVSVADGGGLTVVVITDDEVTGLPQVVFEMSELSVLENVNEATPVCVRLIGGDLMGEGATIEVSTQPGTAQATLDYVPFSVTLNLPANSPNGTGQCTAFVVQDDEEMEEREYFSLRIENQSPDVVTVFEGQDELLIRILDDDSPMAVVGFQVIKSTVDESVANKFTCIEIFSGGPLLYDSAVTFYTQDDSATAPEDYTAVSRTLIFRAGADGSRPSDAVCVSVPIIDDNEAEGLESLIFNIAAVDVDRIRVDEERSRKLLYIEDNDVIRVGFERNQYVTSEALDPDFGLLVCVTVEDVIFPFSLTTSTQDITAQEILDYRVNNSPLQFLVADGNQTQCAYVQVVNDGIFEFPETFTFVLTSNDDSVVVINPFATVTILDRSRDRE